MSWTEYDHETERLKRMVRRKKYCLLKWVGKRLYFREYGPIGPRFTDKRREALKFETKEDAMRESAYCHPMCLVEAREYRR